MVVVVEKGRCDFDLNFTTLETYYMWIRIFILLIRVGVSKPKKQRRKRIAYNVVANGIMCNAVTAGNNRKVAIAKTKSNIFGTYDDK